MPGFDPLSKAEQLRYLHALWDQISDKACALTAFGKDGSILLTNHAFATMIPANFTVLNVFVDDKESALVRPSIP